MSGSREIDELVFLKLGGSLITDKTREATPRREVICRVAGEIASAVASRPDLRLLVGHGSGSFGHFPAQLYGTRDGISSPEGWKGYVETGFAAASLNRMVVEVFRERGLPVMPFQPSASARCRDGEIADMAVGPIGMALENGLMPLVYGDVALDETQGCTIISTEQIFAHLAGRLTPDRVILAGEVDGVFTANPHSDDEAALISEITPQNIQRVRALLSESRGVDVTGGMLSKIESMWRLVNTYPRMTVRVISGLRGGLVERALRDRALGIGTVLRAR
jgi:isopentenyl phosphate kinase